MLIGKIFRPAQSLVEFPGEMKKLSQLLETFASLDLLTTENRLAGNFHDIIGSVSFPGRLFCQRSDACVKCLFFSRYF